MTAAIRSVSYGGGVQSTALLALAATGVIDYPLFLFSNVGEKAEHPATLAYVRDVAMPYAAAHGIELAELTKTRHGEPEDLWDRLTRDGSRSLPIPVRMSNGAPGTRSCTADHKIRVVAKELKRRGATAEHPAVVAIGISVDEIERANKRKHTDDHEQVVYPLLDIDHVDDLGGRRRGLRRVDCIRVIERAGLPVPPKSSCFFCPFHRLHTWQLQAAEEPELFARSVELEETLNARRALLGKDPVYLTRYGRPLADVVAAGTQTPPLLNEDGPGCDEGACFT